MKLRITHISDTHNKHKQLNDKLPGGDILIHSGDISSLGRQREVEGFVKWFNGVDGYTYKIFVAGNHDMSFDSEKLMQDKINYFDPSKTVWESEGIENEPAEGKPEWLNDLLATGLNPNVFYLENSYVELDQIKIWGSPYSAKFGYGWGFNVNRGYDSAQLWNQIPDDTDIVITHGPIYGYGDMTSNTYQNVGCEDLYRRLKQLGTPLHFAGHIHESYGIMDSPDTMFANASILNERYELVNKPLEFFL